MAEHEIDVLKLGIDIGKLNASDINNIRSLTNNLKDLDNILTNSFMKKLEVLSNIKINVDTSSLKKANTQISKTTSDIRGMLQTEEVSIGGGSGKSRDELINNYRKIINDTKKSLNSVEADLASAKGSPLEKRIGRMQPVKLRRQISGTMPHPKPLETISTQVRILST